MKSLCPHLSSYQERELPGFLYTAANLSTYTRCTTCLSYLYVKPQFNGHSAVCQIMANISRKQLNCSEHHALYVT